MADDTLPGMSDEKLGVIGTRQLVAVQTLDIARLTAHPVRIIPGTFIAVTGMGPVDSNESGKTSFLAAVSLLLGDPEWRLGGTGTANVEALLFEPITAGATIGGNAANEGYIVGVFADPGDAAATAHTVWMKISATRPHVQVRHAPGVYLARGITDAERHERAPEIFRSLRRDPLGSTEYARELYGRTPRVLAYVASRGRVRSRPSLLKLDAGIFTPEQIGDALITLAGRATLFEHDQEDRQKVAAQQEELALLTRSNGEHDARESEILRQVTARNQLRSDARSAAELWSRHRARAVLDTIAKARSAIVLLRTATAERDESGEERTRIQAELGRLRNVAALRKTVAERGRELAAHKDAHNNALVAQGRLEEELSRLESELAHNRQKAAGYDVSREGSAERRAELRDELDHRLTQARKSCDEARAKLLQLEKDIEDARDGLFGTPGLAIRSLSAAAVPAVSLAEVTRLAPETRPVWEARLAPWHEAVCIDQEHLPKALAALAGMPGAILITPGEPAQVNGATLPAGVLSAPSQAASFLHLLASQRGALDPVPHSSDPESGIHLIGGFDTPVVGGEDIREYLRQRHGQDLDILDRLNRQADSLRIQLEVATADADRALAAQHVAEFEPESAELAGKLASHRNAAVPSLAENADLAQNALNDAEQRLKDREKTIVQLSSTVSDLSRQLNAKDLEIERLKACSQPDDTVLAAWNRGEDAARAELGWPPEDPDPGIPDQIREQALVPAGAGETAKAMERRPAADLARAARTRLAVALARLSGHGDGTGGPPPEILVAASDFLRHEDEAGSLPDDRLLESSLASLQGWLDDEQDRDRDAPEAVAKARNEREERTEFIRRKTRELETALAETQEAIAARAFGAVELMGQKLVKLNKAANGLGARLDCEIIPPAASDKNWTCRVTPRWRRNPYGPMLPYDNVTNTAQEKLFSVHLVLAALLAAPHPRGRVLILDELADSLGAEHRREVLDAIATAATDEGITILATCQDAILTEARPYCGEILYFSYPSKSDLLNRPTRIFGIDPDGSRVELTSEALTEGRSPAKSPGNPTD